MSDRDRLLKFEDKKLITYCLTNRNNKTCKDENFWKQRFSDKYGSSALQYKSPKKTWKTFYLQTVYYFSQVPLSASVAFHKPIDKILAYAVKDGQKDLINFFISRGAKNWDLALEGAALRGDIELINYFIAKGANEWGIALVAAASEGHFNLVKFFLSKGVRLEELADAINYAENYPEIVTYLQSKYDQVAKLVNYNEDAIVGVH